MITPLHFIAIIVLVALSAFFSCSEMVFSSANKMRLENAAEDGNANAKLALRITERFDDALSAILVGNNLVNIATSSIGSVIAVTLWGEEWTWVSTAVLTVSVIIFGETMPKIIAKKNCNRLALILCYPIRFLTIVLKPVTLIVVGLVKLIMLFLPKPQLSRDEDEAHQELQSLIETAEDENVLDETQSEMLQAALEFKDISISEVMTARVDSVAIDIDDGLESILKQAETLTYSRLPVYEGSIDNIIGILYLNRLYRHLAVEDEVDLRSILISPIYLYKTTKLLPAINKLRSARQHLAIVTGEYGGMVGLVTLEDIMEELVGDIWDENDIDEEEEVVAHSAGVYELDGAMQMSDFIDLMDWKEDEVDAESTTVGGWTTERFGTFPKEGDSFQFMDIVLTVLDMEVRRVRRVLVKKIDQQD